MNSPALSAADLGACGISRTDTRALYPALHVAAATDNAGLPLLLVENALGRAVVALQGAHVVSFRPHGQREMLWLSPRCKLQQGVAIRGGIPLCLPWFGPGPDGKSAHGFARVAPWTPVGARRLADGASELTLELAGDAAYHALWPHAFVFRLRLVVGTTLTLTLSVRNDSDIPAPLAYAWHTYFAVPDVAQTQLAGLEDTDYLDKLDNGARRRQSGRVVLAAATDRIYVDVPQRQTLYSSDGRIDIDSATHCAVVWNAWDNDRNIADMGAGNHVGYLCVERGEVADRALTLAPGATYAADMTLSLHDGA